MVLDYSTYPDRTELCEMFILTHQRERREIMGNGEGETALGLNCHCNLVQSIEWEGTKHNPHLQ